MHPLYDYKQYGACGTRKALTRFIVAYWSTFWTARLKDAKLFQCRGHSSFKGSIAILMETVRQFLTSQLQVNSWAELMYLLGTPENNAGQHWNLRQSIPNITGQGEYTHIGLDFHESLTRLSQDLRTLEDEWLYHKEVWLQMQHFLWRSPTSLPNARLFQGAQGSYDGLQLGFPVLISHHDLNTFVILRTLYRLVRVGGYHRHNPRCI